MSNKPHTAVIDCRLEVYELSDAGECTKPIHPERLEENKIPPSFLLSVSGYDLQDCLNKLKAKIVEFNRES